MNTHLVAQFHPDNADQLLWTIDISDDTPELVDSYRLLTTPTPPADHPIPDADIDAAHAAATAWCHGWYGPGPLAFTDIPAHLIAYLDVQHIEQIEHR